MRMELERVLARVHRAAEPGSADDGEGVRGASDDGSVGSEVVEERDVASPRLVTIDELVEVAGLDRDIGDRRVSGAPVFTAGGYLARSPLPRDLLDRRRVRPSGYQAATSTVAWKSTCSAVRRSFTTWCRGAGTLRPSCRIPRRCISIACPMRPPRRRISMKRVQYLVRINKDSKGDWEASIPDLPGCVATGKTIDSALR
jgi:hypothetical protein